jgi:hypothetical protein
MERKIWEKAGEERGVKRVERVGRMRRRNSGEEDERKRGERLGRTRRRNTGERDEKRAGRKRKSGGRSDLRKKSWCM